MDRYYRQNEASKAGDTDEVVVKIPGVLCSKTLPPVSPALAVDTDEHVRKLRQFVKLTGFSSTSFDVMEGKILEVVRAFSLAIHPGKLMDVVFNGYDGHRSLDAHTRYFTERRQAPSLTHQPFAVDVDPNQVLEEVRGGKYIHTTENVVQYVSLDESSGSDTRYCRVSPTVFKEGDVVEVWAAFTAFPVSKNDYKLVLSMRMLVLLTSEHRKAAEGRKSEARQVRLQMLRDAKAGKRETPSTGSLKRKYMPTIGDEVGREEASAAGHWGQDMYD
ncbi:hypothetical protein MD484_g2530, partial [Candolleomyces efflorescens]